MLAKGLVCAVIGGLAGAAAWFGLCVLTGWNLWVLAPLVGGAAGFGMMRGTQMKGGAPAGALAAAVTLAAVFGARWMIVSREAEESLRVTDEMAISHLEDEAAADYERRGYEVYDAEGGYANRVRAKAAQQWEEMSEYERGQYIAGWQAQNEELAGALTPIGLLLDFGIFGTVCAALAAGTAFKTGSATLEGALADRGLCPEEAATESARMRTEEAGSSTGGWALRMRAEDRAAAAGDKAARPAA